MRTELTLDRAVARTLIETGWGYSYIHVFPDRFLFNMINLNLIGEEICRANMNI